jgi:hypothetical protein
MTDLEILEYNNFIDNEEMSRTELKELKAKEDSNIVVDILLDKFRNIKNVEIKNIRNYLWFSKKLSIDIYVENKLVTLMFHDKNLQYKNLLNYNFNRKHWDLSVKSNDLKYEIVDKGFNTILETLQKPNFLIFLSCL